MPQGVGNFVYFIREGTTVDATTVSITAKPDHDPAANWTAYELGNCEGITSNVDVQKDESYAPGSNGAYVKKGSVVTQASTEFVATFSKLDLLAYELLFGTGQLTAGVAGQVMAGAYEVEGWVWLKQLDVADGDTILDVEFWTSATIQGMNFERGIVRPQITFPVLDAAALGTITVDNLE
jgi:hypothetical protein